MIYARPDATFTAVLQGAATGLTGTLGVRIENGDGTNHTARTTAGIVETEAASGVYAKDDLTAPDTAGTFIVLWDAAGTFYAEPLMVGYNLPAPPATGDLLMSVEDYKDAIGETGSENDDRYEFALSAASQAIRNFTDRDFGTDLVTEARVYQPSYLGNFVEIDDYIDITDVDGLSGLNWEARGEGPAAAAGIYTWIEFADRRYSSALMGFTRNEDTFSLVGADNDITVTATFGWPEVPADVLQALIWAMGDFVGDLDNAQGALQAKTVAEVHESYSAPSFYNREPDGSTGVESLSGRSRSLLLPYRRVT